MLPPDERPYFAFIDESGVGEGDPSQPLLGVGVLLVRDTGRLHESLVQLKRWGGRSARQRGAFEFKFSSVTTAGAPIYREFITRLWRAPDVRVGILIRERESLDKVKFDKLAAWHFYLETICKAIELTISASGVSVPVVAIMDYLNRPNYSSESLEERLTSVPGVANVVMLDSGSSLFIQAIDLLVGATVYHCKQRRKEFASMEGPKSELAKHLEKLAQQDRDSAFLHVWAP